MRKLVIAAGILLLLYGCGSSGGSSGDEDTILSIPPAITSTGEDRPACEVITVTEGQDLNETIQAQSPDGEAVRLEVDGLPAWLDFDEETGILSGKAPLWPDDKEERDQQPGTFDLTFRAAAGDWNIEKIVSVQVIDANWTGMTFPELVASRPLAQPCVFHTPVTLENVQTQVINSEFGGRQIQRIQFGFTSQVPNVEGWEDHWRSDYNVAFLPVDGPAVPNAGAVVEGTYSRNTEDFGLNELGERVCAELGIPVLVIDWGWDFVHPSDVMSACNDRAATQRDPSYMFYPFAVSHYIRSADALATVMADIAGWQVDYDTFKVVFTGHSKFGHTAFLSAAADPQRVVGFMSSGAAGLDGDTGRLLATLQGATSFSPEGHLGYVGVMSRMFCTDYKAQGLIPDDVFCIETLGTDDNRGEDDDYTAKYGLLMMDRYISVDHRVLSMPNIPHTTTTPAQSTVWRMLLAHVFLGRPLTSIHGVTHRVSAEGLVVTAQIESTATIQGVKTWYTTQNDKDISDWDGFVDINMEKQDGNTYQALIPADATAYFVEVRDEADGVAGIVTSAPLPADRDYPILGIPPDVVTQAQAVQTQDGITITWQNPDSPDLAGTTVVRKDGEAPASPLDGTVVCAGSIESCNDMDIDAQTPVFSIFTFDATGAFSEPVEVVVGD